MDPDRYFPTATFYSVLALAECGIWDSDDSDKRSLKTPELTGHLSSRFSKPRDILDKLLSLSPAPSKAAPPGWPAEARWVHNVFSHSRHYKDPPAIRQVVLVSPFVQAVAAIVQHMAPTLKDPEKLQLSAGLDSALVRLFRTLGVNGPEDPAVRNKARAGQLNAYLATAFVKALIARESLLVILPYTAEWDITLATNVRSSLKDYLEREIDELMAHAHEPHDPRQDATSLAFAICGMACLDPEFSHSQFFGSCLDVVVKGQTAEGTWPPGISVTYTSDPSGDTIQQPSVAVALALAEAVLDPALLIDLQPEMTHSVSRTVEGLDRLAQYLKATHVKGPDSSGWVTERTRVLHEVEAWITAMVAQVFCRLWIGARMIERWTTLRTYGVRFHDSTQTPMLACRTWDEAVARWTEKVMEPDSVGKPTLTLLDRVVAPVFNQRSRGAVFTRLEKHDVSYVLFGPPGSGKTYLVRELARFLGWPLVTLTPGHFIRDGLEFIESTARRVFDDLSRLDHAVVFFDECDELFRDRTTNEQGFRNILSFATASMLPKLQGLHDDRKVVVMVGTNFLHRIDPAIRRAGRFDHMLLVDRPDADARRGFLSREISGLTPSELDNLVKSSRGATAGELSAIAKAYPRPLSVSLAEYGEWCKDVGGRELKVASMPDDQRSAVAARWKAIVTDAKV